MLREEVREAISRARLLSSGFALPLLMTETAFWLSVKICTDLLRRKELKGLILRCRPQSSRSVLSEVEWVR